jgi:hypothetical protein
LAGGCFKDFPRECEGCDHFTEVVRQTRGWFEVVCLGFDARVPAASVTKECRLYRKTHQERAE